MGYPRDFRHVRRFCALDNDPLDLALGIFLETKFDEQVQRQRTLHEEKENS